MENFQMVLKIQSLFKVYFWCNIQAVLESDMEYKAGRLGCGKFRNVLLYLWTSRKTSQLISERFNRTAFGWRTEWLNEISVPGIREKMEGSANWQTAQESVTQNTLLSHQTEWYPLPLPPFPFLLQEPGWMATPCSPSWNDNCRISSVN